MNTILSAFYQETIRNSWAEKLPGKSLRWGVFTGLGSLADSQGAGGWGTAAGIAISAVDAFLLDKLFSGWKPHHFVESDLRFTFNRKTPEFVQHQPS